MKKRKKEGSGLGARLLMFALTLSVTASLAVLPQTATEANAATTTLKLGDYVQMGEFNGTAMVFRVVAFEKITSGMADSTDFSSSQESGYYPLLLYEVSKTQGSSSLTSGPYAPESDKYPNSDDNRKSSGSNYWETSSLKTWLNSNESTVTYTYGTPSSGYGSYAGFLTNFEGYEKAAMVRNVTQKTIVSGTYSNERNGGSAVHNYDDGKYGTDNVLDNYQSAYFKYTTDTVFVLDIPQMLQAKSNSCTGDNAFSQVWLRDASASTTHATRFWYYGSLFYASSSSTSHAIRPAFFLDTSSLTLSGSGTSASPYTISSVSLANATVTLSQSSYTYTGSACTPTPTVTIGGATLTQGTDYTVSYSNNTNAGDATVTITGTGSFTGTVSTTFQITQATNSWTTTPSIASVTYPTAISPVGAAKFGSVSITYAGTDGTSYGTTKPTAAGSYKATFTVAETKNYTGLSQTVSFTISKATNTWKNGPTVSSVTYGTEVTTVAEPTYGTVSVTYMGVNGTDYSSSTKPTEVGSYTATFTVAEGTNYTGLSQTVSFTISKATNYWTTNPSIASVTYGTALQPQCGARFGNVVITYTGRDGTSYSSTTAPTNAGSYTASFTVEATDNYTGLSTDVIFTISKATPAAVKFPSAAAITYGQTLSESALTGGTGDGTFAWTNGATVPTVENSGYEVTFTPNDTANYDYSNVTLTQTVQITVYKAAAAVTTVPAAIADLVYNGAAQTLVTAGTASGGTMSYATGTGSSTAPTDGWSATIPTGTNAGTYYVWYKAAGDANHSDTTAVCVSVTISPKSLSGAAVSDIAAQTYTGSEIKPSVTVKLDGVTLTEAVDYTVSYSNNIDAGTAKAIVTGTGNYTGAVSAEFTINKASQTVSKPKAQETSYTTITLEAMTGSGTTEYAVNTENTVPTDGWQTSTEFTNLTQNTTYYFFARFSGDDNHEPATSEGAEIKTIDHTHVWEYTADGGVITATCTGGGTCGLSNSGGKVTLTAPSEDLVYNGSAHNAAVTSTLVTGETVPPVSYTFSATEDGEYKSVSDTAAAGYYKASLTVGGATAAVAYRVEKAAITLTVTMEGWTYGETAKEPSVSGNTGNGTVTYTYKKADDVFDQYSSDKPSAAGTYIVKAVATETDNYKSGSATAEFTIAKASAEVTAPSAKEGLVYNGLAQELISAGSTTGGELQYKLGESGMYSTSIPTATDAGEYTIWYKAAGGDNYNDSEEGSVTVTISRANGEASVSITNYICGADVEPQPQSLTNGTDHVSYEYKPSGSDDSAYTATRPLSAGSYTIKATFAQTNNYNAVVATNSFTVSHSYGAWNITSTPSKTVTGEAERVCSGNKSHTETKTLPVLTDTSVWTCEYSRKATETSNGIEMYTSDYGTVTIIVSATAHEHTWSNWTITIEPTETTIGRADRVCTADSTHTDAVILPKLTDTSVWTLDESKTVEPTETEDGSRTYTSALYGSVTVAVAATGHEHTYSDEWTASETTHYHEATCGHDVISDEALHTWTSETIKEATQTEKGEVKYTCTVCGYEKTEEIPVKGHTHSYSTDWSKDSVNHWHACECGARQDSAAHTFETEITTPATCTTAGEQTKTCTVCGYSVTEAISATGHSYSTDWTSDETNHWHAATCGHNVKSGEAAHTWVSEITKQATEDEKGELTYTCVICGYKYTTELEKLDHVHTLSVWVIETIPTATTEGSATRSCTKSTCDYSETVTLPVLGDTSFWTSTVVKAATHTEDGLIKYTSEYGTVAVTVPANEHDHEWGDWEITTDPTETAIGAAQRVCTLAASHTETVIIPALSDTDVWTENETQYVEATETTEGKRVYTSEYGTVTLVLPALGHTHTFADAWTATETTHYHAATCSHTDEKADEANHIYGAGEVVTAATETEKGEMQYTCTVCGYEKKEEIPLLGHTHKYSDTWSKDSVNHWYECSCGARDQSAAHTFETKVTKAATCTEAGEQTKTCTVCGYSVTEAISAIGHTWDSGEVTKEPTCTDTGVMTYKCTVDGCGATKTEEIAVDASAHKYGKWGIVIDPTYETKGMAQRECEYNNGHIESLTIPDLTNEIWVEDADKSIEPTETEDGYKVYTSDYGAVTVTIPATGHTHTWGDWSIVVAPTETAEGAAQRVCTGDSSHIDTVILPELTDTNVWTENADEYKAPTCTESGQKVYTSDYGDVTVTLAATGHSYSTDWTSDESNHWHAATCGHTDEKSDEANHIYGAGVVTKEATEATTGAMKYTCTVCGYEKTEEIPILGHTHSYDTSWSKDAVNHWHECSCGARADSAAHSWNGGEVTTAATCTEKGEMTYTCSVCGEAKTEEIPATGHTWNDGEVTIEPTCTSTGVKTYTCTTCNETKSEEIAVDTSAHKYGSWSIAIDPTYETKGMVQRECEYNNGHIESLTIPDLTDASVWTAGKKVEPTETEDGYQIYTSEYGTVTVTLAATEHIHAWGDWKIVILPSETIEGAAQRVCEKNNEHIDTVIIPALTDTTFWVAGARVEPTCTSEGSQVYHSIYGDITVTLEALEHTWNNGVATKEATCVETGIMTYTCTVCGTVKTKEIPIDASAHKYGDWSIVIDPTYETKGMAQCECEYNSGHIESLTIPDLTDGSVWTAGKKVEPTETEDGYQIYTSEYGTVTVTIPATGHTHTFANAWTMTETTHYHAATCGHDVKADEAEHTWTSETVKEATETEKGEMKYTCTICGYVKTEEIPVTGHIHSYSDAWSYDAVSHWHACECGARDQSAAHTWEERTRNGITERTCTICEYETSAAIEYAVTLHPNGGTVNSGNITSYIYGSGAVLPYDLTKDGFYFEGWYDNAECTGAPVTAILATDTGDKEYWAKWTDAESAEYLITFINYDNSVLQSGTAEAGTIPEYTGETPAKPDDDVYSYTFSGWLPELAEVTGIATYTAQYTKTPIAYSIKWQEDGSITVTASEAGTYCVIFATYTDGVLTCVKIVDAVFDTAGEITMPTPDGFDANGADKVKAMMLHALSDMIPMCEAASR